MADSKSTIQQPESTSPINTYEREDATNRGTLNTERVDDGAVGVYERPAEGSRSTTSAWSIILVLALLALVAYFLVQFVF